MSPAVETFIALARDDLSMARTLLASHPRGAAFHVEQAAEKLLKAVLTTEGIMFSAGHHQLGRLAETLPVDHVWRADLMAFDAYTTYATSMRYPLPGGGMPRAPDKAIVETAIQTVSSLVGEIADWCREKLADTPRPKRP
jgi:HEPN domain-containing protein